MRDKSIPKAALYDEASQTYQMGGRNTERWQIWHPCGSVMLDACFENGKLDGTLRLKLIGADAEYGTDHYGFSLSLIKELGLPDGDGLSELIASYDDGALREARFVLFGGKEMEQNKVVATFGAAGIEKLWWKVCGDESIFKYGDVCVVHKDMKVTKPWSHAIELGFVEGKIKTRSYIDKSGAVQPAKRAPKKLTEWGQGTKTLDGYIESGAFAADLEAFFSDAARDEPDPDAKRAEKVFAQLPAAHRKAALAFHAIVRAGFPVLLKAQLSGYGFDCVENELHNATDPKYFGLSYTGDGDLQLLDLETGQVLEWVHDYDPFEDDAIFPSLDAYAFAIVRVELAAQKRIAKADVEAVFERLGFGWARTLI